MHTRIHAVGGHDFRQGNPKRKEIGDEMRVIGYARCSVDEQINGTTLDNQTSKLRGFAALHDLEMVDVIVDAGVSGKSLKRPGLQRALAMLRSGQADGCVVSKLDRLSRSVSDWNSLIDGYFGEKAGKLLMSISDSIDTRSPGGRLVLNVLMSVAQWERETIVERTTDAMRHKKRNGERVGKIPYGFDVGPNGKTLVPNETEQTVIAMMQAWRRDGRTLQWITDELNREAVPAKECGAKWHLSCVHKLLKRTVETVGVQ